MTDKICPICSEYVQALTAQCPYCFHILDPVLYNYFHTTVDISDPYRDLLDKIDMLEKRISILESKE
jgi:hypothetical protein